MRFAVLPSWRYGGTFHSHDTWPRAILGLDDAKGSELKESHYSATWHFVFLRLTEHLTSTIRFSRNLLSYTCSTSTNGIRGHFLFSIAFIAGTVTVCVPLRQHQPHHLDNLHGHFMICAPTA